MPSSHQERLKNSPSWMWCALLWGWGVQFILGSPLCFLFLLGFFLVVVFFPLFTSFCHICGRYFDVWWLNLRMNPHSQYLCPTSANRAPTEHFIFNEFCALKDEQGPCKAIKDRFFFNVDNGRCELFEYGGCGGNANNFETLEECEETCVVSGKSDNSTDCFRCLTLKTHLHIRWNYLIISVIQRNDIFISASDNVALLCTCVYFWQPL